MSGYIDADKLCEELQTMIDNIPTSFPLLDRELRNNMERGIQIARQFVMNLMPTADVQEVKHARFISEIVKKPDWKGKIQEYYQPNSCSNCHKALRGIENFCSECGAKMDEKMEDK